ncbi:MAG TPA: hypothetical protein IAC24_01355 [Candidatus Onthousia faecigallinarum]|nr:hypothetical protein [Candidatus Onthousia faecigallinarum]
MRLTKIIYGLRLIASFLYVVLIYLLLNIIFESGWQGMVFLILSLAFIVVTLVTLLSHKEIFQKTISYNIVIIAAVVYLAIVVVRCLEAVHQYNSNLYILNMEYCKTNFIILSFVLIGILLNTMVLFLSDNETQQKKPIKR